MPMLIPMMTVMMMMRKQGWSAKLGWWLWGDGYHEAYFWEFHTRTPPHLPFSTVIIIVIIVVIIITNNILTINRCVSQGYLMLQMNRYPLVLASLLQQNIESVLVFTSQRHIFPMLFLLSSANKPDIERTKILEFLCC